MTSEKRSPHFYCRSQKARFAESQDANDRKVAAGKSASGEGRKVFKALPTRRRGGKPEARGGGRKKDNLKFSAGRAMIMI